jgi:hypothetical protein
VAGQIWHPGPDDLASWTDQCMPRTTVSVRFVYKARRGSSSAAYASPARHLSRRPRRAVGSQRDSAVLQYQADRLVPAMIQRLPVEFNAHSHCSINLLRLKYGGRNTHACRTRQCAVGPAGEIIWTREPNCIFVHLIQNLLVHSHVFLE